MTSEFTYNTNIENVKNIREQIERKKQSEPYYSTVKQAKEVLTDYDTLPYPRWFRGVPTSSIPIVAEREAGWRPRHDDCYNAVVPCEDTDLPEPNICFEPACSTVYPCIPKFSQRNIEDRERAIVHNRSCIVQYR